MTRIPNLSLNDGHVIPQIGYGTFQVPPAETATAVAAALAAGYRHIDTAQMYGDEAGVGEAVRASGLPRDELFVTSKLNTGAHLPDDAWRAFEVNPYFTNDPLRAFGQEHGILTEAWSPLAQGAVLGEVALGQVAERVGRTPAQVVMRWHLQRGDIVFPKTMSPERMRENLDVLGFELSPEDMAAVATVDRGPGGRTGPDPDTFDYKPA